MQARDHSPSIRNLSAVKWLISMMTTLKNRPSMKPTTLMLCGVSMEVTTELERCVRSSEAPSTANIGKDETGGKTSHLKAYP